MSHASDLELIAIVPWDDEIRGLPSTLEDQPQLGFVVPEQVRQARAPVQVRLDGSGGYDLLAATGGILHLGADGEPTGRTPLSSRGDRIVDYACGAQARCVLLEQGRGATGSIHRLRGLDPSGAERWSRTGPVEVGRLDFAALRGTFTRVSFDRAGRLYLPAGDGSAVAELDAETGAVVRVLEQRPGAGVPFVAADRLVAVFFDDDSGQRGIAVLDPAGDSSSEWRGSAEHFAWLVHPFGADDRARLYVWREGRIRRISLSGELEALAAIDGIAVRAADRQVFGSHADAEGVRVRGPQGGTTLSAPAGYRLVHVDAKGRYHLFGGEGPGEAGELRIYSAAGQLEATTTPPADFFKLECRVPPYHHWRVEAGGRIVIPVVIPEGLAIVGVRTPSSTASSWRSSSG